MTEIVDAIREKGIFLEFQRYAGFFEDFQNRLCVGYSFFVVSLKNIYIVKIHQSKLPFNAA